MVAGKVLNLSTIGDSEAVKDTALVCHPHKDDYIAIIKKAFAKMFVLHGQQYSPDLIEGFTQAITETYKHESPKTILLFLHKAASGDFGKFYGSPDIGTIREWFADFLLQTIIPARERYQTEHKESYDSTREQIQSPREYLEKGGAKPVTNYLKRVK